MENQKPYNITRNVLATCGPFGAGFRRKTSLLLAEQNSDDAAVLSYADACKMVEMFQAEYPNNVYNVLLCREEGAAINTSVEKMSAAYELSEEVGCAASPA